RVCRQGPADPSRAVGPWAVLAALLRCRGAGDMSRRALGRARPGGGEARGDARPRTLRVAVRRGGRAHPVHVGRPLDHDALDEPPDLPTAHVVLIASSAELGGGVAWSGAQA